MAVTRSWTTPGTAPVMVSVPRHGAALGLAWLGAASLVVSTGLWFVYQAKVQRISGGPVLNLNLVTSPEDLLPVLEFFPNRAALAPRIYSFLERAGPLRHPGALTAVIPRRDFARLKPLIAVRGPAEFGVQLVRSALLYFAGFYLVALIWRLTRFRGDAALLPALQLLTGFGFLLMVSMRDPLRDTLEFHKFAIGVFLGSLLLALPAFQIFNYRRLSSWCYTPLFVALGLFGLLMAFGRGPAGNDAKVNLGMFQPVELIKILLVMFLAGYFTRHWERLRDLREERVPGGRVARAEHVVPVLVATAISLGLFFVLKDLGPALVTMFVFLAVFTVARGKPALAIAALILMVAAVTIGYRAGTPHTVVQRIAMGLCRRGRGVCPVRRIDLAGPARGTTRGHYLRLLPGNGTIHAYRLRDAAHHRRRAGRAAAFRRGIAVSQFREHRHGGELPGVCAAGGYRQYAGSNPAGGIACAFGPSQAGAGRGRRDPAGVRPALSRLTRHRLPGTRCARLRRRQRQTPTAQPAHQLPGARDPPRNHLRPQRRAACHQQLAGTGAPSRCLQLSRRFDRGGRQPLRQPSLPLRRGHRPPDWRFAHRRKFSRRQRVPGGARRQSPPARVRVRRTGASHPLQIGRAHV